MATTDNLEMTPPSSSSSPPTIWDVFLSFYGKDTRGNFTSHLYKALVDVGIITFKDDHELDKGQEISSGLLDAIKDSKMFVVVLSENYARSPWCLDELMEILSCKRTESQVVPVFYYVDPSDVRYQKGSFGEALDHHKKRYSDDMIHKWRSALVQIAQLSGYHLKKHANENESETIQEIVENVERQVSTKVLHLENPLFGINSAVEEIYQKLRMELNHVRAIGICGMGGIGKTTIAKAFYNEYSNRFEISCFIDKVKQYSQGGSPLLPLLNQVLIGILRKKDYKVTDVGSGFRQLEQILRVKKALIVLDDLDQSSYSEFLKTLCNFFSAESRIIVTTRDVKLLNQLKIDLKEVDIYMMKILGKVDSLELFSYHAFRTPTPPTNFRVLSESFVAYARGLPLALKVLGSSLCGTHEVFWKAKLEKIKEIPENEILEILRLSYDELRGDTEKAIFLDIAFFFVGKYKTNAVEIFESCDFFPEVGITILIERCLLEIDEDDNFQMHDLIQDMGRELGKSTHLFWRGNALRDLQNKEPFKSMKTIHVNFSVKLKTTPDFGNSKLVERLCFFGCENLRKVHPSITELTSLYVLDLGECSNIRRLPMKQSWANMGYLYLGHCSNIRRLPNQLDDMKGLKFLDASHTAIEELPDSITQLKELVELDLSSCEKLIKLPEQIGNMQGLEIFRAGYTALEQLPDSFVCLINLERLDLGFCKNLRNLPDSIWKLKLLKVLDLGSCSKLKRLPEELGKMQCLEFLGASDTAIKQVPDSIGQLSRLEWLGLCHCRKLKYVPNSVWNLTSLTHLSLLQVHICEINLPDTVKDTKLVELSLNCDIRLWLPMILRFSSLKRLSLRDEG